MPPRKQSATIEEVATLAGRADDLAFDIMALADRIQPGLREHPLIEPTQKFNRLAEACTAVNRMLLAMAVLQAQAVEIEREYAKRAKA